MDGNFTLFPQLPAEVRKLIIRFIINDTAPKNSRIIQLVSAINPGVPAESQLTIQHRGFGEPVWFRINKEFNSEAMKHLVKYEGKLINFSTDIFYVWSFRQSMTLNILTLIPNHVLSNIARIALRLGDSVPRDAIPLTAVSKALDLRDCLPHLAQISFVTKRHSWRGRRLLTHFLPIGDDELRKLRQSCVEIDEIMLYFEMAKSEEWNPEVVFLGDLFVSTI